MKVWLGHGTEHSENLVMIGHFKDAQSAASARQTIEQLAQQVEADTRDGLMEIGERANNFTEPMLGLLRDINVYSVAPAELEQFAYDVTVKIVEDTKVLITTDEIDVSAYLKVLLDGGARIEVYSAHNHPDTGYGRGR